MRDLGHEVRVVGPAQHASASFGDDAGLIAHLKKHVPGSIYELAELAYNIPAFWRLAKAYRAMKPDLLYERYSLFLLAGLWLRRLFGVPMLLEVNAPLAAERKRFDNLRLAGLAHRAEGWAWRGADRALPVTGVLAEHLHAKQVPGDQITVIPNGIGPAFLAPPPSTKSAQAALGISANVVLGFVGFMRPWHGLDRVIDFTTAERNQLRQRILNFTATAGGPNRDSTDFVKPLSDIYALINEDIALTRLMQMNDETRARYSVIFLSDGQPTTNQDDELLCGDAVRRIRQLRDLADDVRVNTVHVFTPTQPIASTACTFDGGVTIPVGGTVCGIPELPPGACPLLVVNNNAERLNQMATLGGGDFRDFRNNEPINFLNFRFGQVRRTFIFDKLVASNLSAPPGSPLELADTDSDGLLDEDEFEEGTLPWVADTDGDGFSDGVEVYFRSRGADFTPDQEPLPDGGGVDPGCPPELRGVDSDCDTLTDCDEQIIGTNSRRIDSDDDGIADAVEFKLGSQPSSKDLPQDPDNDRVPTGDELTMHMNPLVADSDDLSVDGYRYDVKKKAGLEADGRQCWTFKISNVAMANTLPDTRDPTNPDGGTELLYRRGAGYNDLFVTFSMTPGDDPTGRTILRTFRHTSSRFPVGGIKSPHDGIINVRADDFVPGCQSVVQPSTP
ncbi:MAG: glycosyltransferase [Archangium sp.]